MLLSQVRNTGVTFGCYCGDAIMARRTILVVDDEPQIRSLLRKVLARDRHHVIEAADGVEAIDVLQRGTNVDLVLTDIVMPRMNGIELAERVSSQFPAVRVLCMSAHFDVNAVQRNSTGEGWNFLRKPFNVGELSVKVGQLLAEGRVDG
jgi:DNA-binding NtrC family response regulator